MRPVSFRLILFYSATFRPVHRGGLGFVPFLFVPFGSVPLCSIPVNSAPFRSVPFRADPFFRYILGAKTQIDTFVTSSGTTDGFETYDFDVFTRNIEISAVFTGDEQSISISEVCICIVWVK